MKIILYRGMSEFQSAIEEILPRNLDLRTETSVTFGSQKFASTADPNKFDIIFEDTAWLKESLISQNTHLCASGVETVTESDLKVPFDLDPSFEASVDIQELLKGAEVNEEDFESLATALTTREDTTLLELVQRANERSAIDSVTTNTFTNVVFSDNTYKDVEFMNTEDSASKSQGTGEYTLITVNADDLLEQVDETSRDSAFSEQFVSSTVPSPREPAVIRPFRNKPGRKPSGNGPIRPRKRQPPKDTPEYFEKRERNNIAVRKSRDKAKLKQVETEQRVQQLSDENEQLNKKLDLLTKELNVLKSLFINVGSTLPKELEKMLAKCS